VQRQRREHQGERRIAERDRLGRRAAEAAAGAGARLLAPERFGARQVDGVGDVEQAQRGDVADGDDGVGEDGGVFGGQGSAFRARGAEILGMGVTDLARCGGPVWCFVRQHPRWPGWKTLSMLSR